MDDVSLPNVGATIRTDEIGGAHVQIVKLMTGADNVDDGYVAQGNPLPALVKNMFIPAQYDSMQLSYGALGKLETVVFRSGGLSGTIVATVSLGYTGSKLSSVTRT